MSTPDRILYVHGAVEGLASSVNTSASGGMDLHDHVRRETDAIAEFFMGQAAIEFRQNQMILLNAVADLCTVMNQHGHTIQRVNGSAMATDHLMKTVFQL